jgi:lambda family phage portal protein
MGRKSKKKRKNTRAYDGARLNELTSDWSSFTSSADSEIVQGLRSLRNRSRDLCRNNDYISGAIDFIVDNVVGHGSKFQSQVKRRRGNELDEKINDQIESAWVNWGEARICHTGGKLCFAEIEKLILRELIESGEVLIRLVKQPFGGGKIPLALEIIESDQLYDNDFSGSFGQNQIRMGVELDQWMRPVAYHFSENHPGDYQFTRGSQGNRTKRILASEIIHLFVTKRANQTRGVPFLHASLIRTRHLSKYEEAELVKARMQALISAFIQSPEPDVMGTEDDETGRRFQSWEPGDIVPLAPGEQFVGFNPTAPNPNYDPFTRVQNRGISSGLGLSYESYTNDFTNTSYSSARTSRLKEQDRFKNFQHYLLRHFNQILFPQWLDLAVLGGELVLPNYYQDPSRYCQPRFFLRGWHSIDPYKEAQANLLEVKAGFNTVTGILAENGRDLEEILKQRRRELDLFDQYDLSFETTPPPIPEQPKLVLTDEEIKQQNQIELLKRALTKFNKI